MIIYLVNNCRKNNAVIADKINTILPREISLLKTRTFEITSIGGFQLIHRRLSLEYLFKKETDE